MGLKAWLKVLFPKRFQRLWKVQELKELGEELQTLKTDYGWPLAKFEVLMPLIVAGRVLGETLVTIRDCPSFVLPIPFFLEVEYSDYVKAINGYYWKFIYGKDLEDLLTYVNDTDPCIQMIVGWRFRQGR